MGRRMRKVLGKASGQKGLSVESQSRLSHLVQFLHQHATDEHEDVADAGQKGYDPD